MLSALSLIRYAAAISWISSTAKPCILAPMEYLYSRGKTGVTSRIWSNNALASRYMRVLETSLSLLLIPLVRCFDTATAVSKG